MKILSFLGRIIKILLYSCTSFIIYKYVRFYFLLSRSEIICNIRLYNADNKGGQA